jgi:dolichol-phosphate mannosyltransferase
MLKFSVVIPVYNEEQVVVPLYFSLKRILDAIGEAYEIIFVNDGSIDRSLEMLQEIIYLILICL